MAKPKSPRARAAKSRSKDEVVSVVKRMLPVDIDEKITRRKEHRIAEALTEKIKETEKMNAEILPRRKKIKEYENEIETLRAQVMNGTEDREIKCEVVKDYAHLTVKVRRCDTNEVVEERTMTDEDRQEDLLKDRGGKKTKPHPGEDDDDAPHDAADPGAEPADDDEPEVH